MKWLKTIFKSSKAAVVAAVPLTIANPEQLVIDAAVSLTVGLVTGFFDWLKHRND